MLEYKLLKAQISNKRLKIQNLRDSRDYLRAVDPYGFSHIFYQAYINQVWEEMSPLQNKLRDMWLQSSEAKRFADAFLKPILGELQEPSYMRQLFSVEAV